MPTKPKSSLRAKSAFKLPTLSAFKRLSFAAKARVFRDWAKTMRGSYESIDGNRCALAQFSIAIGGSSRVGGSSDTIYDDFETPIPVIDPTKDIKNGVIHDPRQGQFTTTFAALVKRLNTHIAKHYSR